MSSSYGKYYNPDTNLYVISSSADTESTYKSNFDPSNMATFPYLKWDFGFQRYLPQNVVLENFKCTASEVNGVPIYLYPNYDDACFNKPQDFIQPNDYQGLEVDLPDGTKRPMTEDDVFYGPWKITQSVTFVNMNPIEICPDDALYISRLLKANTTIKNSN